MSVRNTEGQPPWSCPRRALEINSSAISIWHTLFYGIINACCKLGFQWVPSLGSVGVHKAFPLQKVLTALLTSNIPSVCIVVGISADGSQWWLTNLLLLSALLPSLPSMQALSSIVPPLSVAGNLQEALANGGKLAWRRWVEAPQTGTWLRGEWLHSRKSHVSALG